MGLTYSNKPGQYWSSLQTHARIYEQDIDRLLDRILGEGNEYYQEHSSQYSTKFKLYKLLGNNAYPEQVKPNISIHNNQITSSPNVSLSDGRQTIVNKILQSNRPVQTKMKLIGGIYAEQIFQNKIDKIVEKKNLKVEDLTKQMTQWDMHIKIDYNPIEIRQDTPPNINKLLTNYGIVLDHKPNIFKFDVTTYKDKDLIIDWTNIDPNNWKDDAIAKILYKKYQNVWPFFVSSDIQGMSKSTDSHIVTPTEFFGKPGQFDIDLLNRGATITRQDLLNYGFDEEEVNEFLEDPGMHYDDLVNAIATQKLVDILQKSYRIQFTKKK